MNPESHPPPEAPVRTPFKRRGHIVLSLLAVLIFVGLAPLATMAHKLIVINREALTTAQQQVQLLLASSMAHELDIQVEALRSQLQHAALRLGASLARQGSATDDEATRGDLNESLDQQMSYLRYTYFRQQGVRSLSAGELPEALEPLLVAGIKEAAEVLARDQQSGQAGPAPISNPMLLGTEPPRAVIVMSAAVVSRGAFHGVLSALVDLQSLWDGVAEQNRTGHVLFALDLNGNVFASSDPRRVLPGQDVSQSPLVQHFLSGDRRARVTMPFDLDSEGERQKFLGSYEPTRQGWGIFVQAPERQVYEPIEVMVKSTKTWAVAALGLAGLAAMFFARGLSDPINKLAAASSAFARGDFSARVQTRLRNEVGELAHTFNSMAEEIEVYIRRLKWAAEENKELFLGTIRALAQAIDAKDPYTRGHSVRVNRYSVLLARELGLSEAEIRDIHVASLLHDVGKIGIDDAILKKPGALTDAEFVIMKTHPVLGANIMEPIRQMKEILPGLRSHHERWTGGGYPDNLAGERIPLMARVIAVADTFDAITTDRPYQKLRTFDEGLERLKELKGRALDTKVVEAFMRLYDQGLIRQETPEPGHSPEPAAAAMGWPT